VDLSKFLRQNQLTRKTKTRKERASYSSVLKTSKRILKAKLPITVKNLKNGEEIIISNKIQKDKIIEEMFNYYRVENELIYIYPIYKPSV
jgi:hypothetical protein